MVTNGLTTSKFDGNKYVKQGLGTETVINLKEVFDWYDYLHRDIINTVRALNFDSKGKYLLLSIVQDIVETLISQLSWKFSDQLEALQMKKLFKQFSQYLILVALEYSDVNNSKQWQQTLEHIRAEIEQIIDYADKDRDGMIIFEQFVKVVTTVYPKV